MECMIDALHTEENNDLLVRQPCLVYMCGRSFVFRLLHEAVTLFRPEMANLRLVRAGWGLGGAQTIVQMYSCPSTHVFPKKHGFI